MYMYMCINFDVDVNVCTMYMYMTRAVQYITMNYLDHGGKKHKEPTTHMYAIIVSYTTACATVYYTDKSLEGKLRAVL